MGKKNYEKVVKVLQILSVVFIIGMVIAGVVLTKKYDISINSVGTLKEYISDNLFMAALIIIVFNFAKAFTLVISPSYVFLLSGMVFQNIWVAMLVNIIAIATSIPVPYFLGRFTGKGMADKLKNKYPKIKKIDRFTDENSFMVVFLVKSTGLIPSDASSMLFGAMGVGFSSFFWATNFGEIPLNILWTLLGHNGNIKDAKTWLYFVPIIVFALVASFIMKKWTDKKSREKTAESSELQEVNQE